MKICIPTFTDEGLEGVPYAHFGSAPYFVLHDTETGDTRVIRNRNEHHEHGTCHPLTALDGEEVDTVLVGGIGRRAYARLHHAGIRVFRAGRGTVRENLHEVRDGRLFEFTTDTACHGHEGGVAGDGGRHSHGHHH